MNYLILKALHLIFIIAWFAGLFYLPRLFVYHAAVTDKISNERFKLMEKRLYYAIMWPGAILVTFFGFLLIRLNYQYYLHAKWMQIKLVLVLLLWIYHLYCGHLVKIFKLDNNKKSSLFFRFFNEIPTVFLIIIIFCAVLK